MRNLLSVKRFSQMYPDFPEGGLRYLIFHSQARQNSKGEVVSGNGLAESGAVIRLGRKILIDEERFFAWVNTRNKEAPPRPVPCERRSVPSAVHQDKRYG